MSARARYADAMPASRRLAWGVLTFFCVGVALVAPLPALLGFYGEQAPAGSQLAHLIELARTPLLAVHAIAGAIALLAAATSSATPRGCAPASP